MSGGAVLDTSAVSLLMRHDPGAIARARARPPGTLILCSPVAAEIGYGLQRLGPSQRRARLTAQWVRYRGVLRWSDWTEAGAEHFARIKAEVERAGTPVADLDLVIASVALALGVGVATANVRDFGRIAGLSVEDWSAG